jgi:hypothetical protein
MSYILKSEFLIVLISNVCVDQLQWPELCEVVREFHWLRSRLWLSGKCLAFLFSEPFPKRVGPLKYI